MVRQVSLRRVGALLLMLALSAVPRQAVAQITSGSVTGSIRDGQGGVIPGAGVTLISAARGTSLEVTSNEHGDFAFPIVWAETYVLRVGLAGFKTLTRPGIIVHAGDRVSLGVLTIEVGEIAETVTVLADSPQLQLKTAERSFAVEGQAVQNIAVNGRGFLTLALLAPGVVSTAAPGTAPGAQHPQRERAANQLEQRPDRRCHRHGHGQQRRPDGGGEPGFHSGSQGADLELPGRVRAIRRRADQRGHQEWRTGVPRVGLLVPAGRRPQCQHVDQQPQHTDDAGSSLGSPRPWVHHRRTGAPARVECGPHEALLLLESGIPVPPEPADDARARPGANRPGTAGRFLPDPRQRRESLPVHSRLHDGPPLQRIRSARLFPGWRCPGTHSPESPVRPWGQHPEHLSDGQQPRDNRAGVQLRHAGSDEPAGTTGPAANGLVSRRAAACDGQAPQQPPELPQSLPVGRTSPIMRRRPCRRHAATSSPAR